MTTLLKLDHKSKSVQVLRAVAFLFVFLFHAFTKLGWWGAFGVSLFIVLSGYLETKKHLYDDISALPFAIKKIKKVCPLHIIMMLFAIPLSAKIALKRHGAIKLLIQIFLNAIMAQSWVPIRAIYYSLNAVSWYLTLVVFLALISPKLMRWLRNSSVRKIKIVVLTLICCDFIVGYLSMRLPEAHWIAYVCPVTRSFDYIIGGGTYVLAHKNIKIWMLPTGLTLAIGMLISSAFADFTNELFSSALWIIPSVLIIPTVTENSLPAWQPFIILGNISFELFLIHQLIIRYLNLVLGHIVAIESLVNKLVIALAAFVISIGATMLYRRISKEIIRKEI